MSYSGRVLHTRHQLKFKCCQRTDNASAPRRTRQPVRSGAAWYGRSWHGVARAHSRIYVMRSLGAYPTARPASTRETPHRTRCALPTTIPSPARRLASHSSGGGRAEAIARRTMLRLYCWNCGWLEARREEPPRLTVWVFWRKSESSAYSLVFSTSGNSGDRSVQRRGRGTA